MPPNSEPPWMSRARLPARALRSGWPPGHPSRSTAAWRALLAADRRLLAVLALGTVTLVLWGCRGAPPLAPYSAPGAALLSAAAGAVHGLRLAPVEEYPGEHLYDFMNGAAVTYLEHHCRTLTAASAFRGSDQAKIELYDLATAADAQALYAELTGKPGTPFAAGEAGCLWEGFEPEALFHRGRFLVRLLGYAKHRDTATALLTEIAAALDAQLGKR